MKSKLLCLCLVMYTALACGDELLLPPPGELGIPETLRVPPIEKKYLALQAILDGTLDSIRVDDQYCQVAQMANDHEVKCRYPDGGSVEFVGEFASEDRDRVVLGRENRSIRQDIKLKFIKLTNYHFSAYSGLKKIAAPNSCKTEAIINGEGRIYGSIEFLVNGVDPGRVLLGSGGVYQGHFDVTIIDKKYNFEFISPGFYYRRDITPLIISPEGRSSELPNISALQISLISSGKFDLNGQHYSYQDVFLEIFTAESFWDAQCTRNAENGGQ